jgi:hypothetical protein
VFFSVLSLTFCKYASNDLLGGCDLSNTVLCRCEKVGSAESFHLKELGKHHIPFFITVPLLGHWHNVVALTPQHILGLC